MWIMSNTMLDLFNVNKLEYKLYVIYNTIKPAPLIHQYCRLYIYMRITETTCMLCEKCTHTVGQISCRVGLSDGLLTVHLSLSLYCNCVIQCMMHVQFPKTAISYQIQFQTMTKDIICQTGLCSRSNVVVVGQS